MLDRREFNELCAALGFTFPAVSAVLTTSASTFAVAARPLSWCEQHGMPVMAYSPLGGDGGREEVAGSHGKFSCVVSSAICVM